MTQGKLTLLIVVATLLIFGIGEIIFRYKCWHMKKTSHLSDYGVRELVSRSSCYALTLVIFMVAGWIIGVIHTIITRWDIPFE